MTVTYLADLSRVRVEHAIPADATDHIDIQRSADGIRWSFVRGGETLAAAPLTTVGLDDFEFPAGVDVSYRVIRYDVGDSILATEDAGSITVDLDQVWLKSITRPFLNRAVEVRNWSDVTRPARNGVFDIVGRSYPVVVTDVRGSRQYTLEINTVTLGEAEELDLVLASGDPIFLHAPSAFRMPEVLMKSTYAVVGNSGERRTGKRGWRAFTLPLTEVAAPHHSIVGMTVTWQSVINAYATWADVIAANVTWADLLDRIGDPIDVLVP